MYEPASWVFAFAVNARVRKSGRRAAESDEKGTNTNRQATTLRTTANFKTRSLSNLSSRLVRKTTVVGSVFEGKWGSIGRMNRTDNGDRVHKRAKKRSQARASSTTCQKVRPRDFVALPLPQPSVIRVREKS